MADSVGPARRSAERVTFRFEATPANGRPISIKVTVVDDDQPYTALADAAFERAHAIAERELQTDDFDLVDA